MLQCGQAEDGVDLGEQTALYLVVQTDMVNDEPVKQSTVHTLAVDTGERHEQKHKVSCAHSQHIGLMVCVAQWSSG